MYFYFFIIFTLFIAADAGDFYIPEDFGIKASIRDFPHQVMIGSGTGSIISKNWVVTSEGTGQLSFYDSPEKWNDMDFWSGRECVYPQSDQNCRGKLHGVDKIVKLERNATYYLSRLVLLRVKDPGFEFDSNCQPISILDSEERKFKIFPGRVANVSGFDLFNTDEIHTHRLKYAEATVVDSETCDGYLKNSDEKIPEGYFCTNYGNNAEFKNSSSRRDAGGATLTVDGKLAGMVQPYPARPIFIDLAYHREWISRHIDQPLITANEIIRH